MNSNAKILVIDDDANNIEMITEFLNDVGYQVYSTLDSRKAFADVNAVLPDLILLDIRMPLVDGFAVAKQVRANATTQNIPIIFVSAQDDSKTMSEGFKQHAMNYIVKPINLHHLLESIEEVLQLSSN